MYSTNVVALRSKGISECYLYEYLKFIKKNTASYDIGSVQPSINNSYYKSSDFSARKMYTEIS